MVVRRAGLASPDDSFGFAAPVRRARSAVPARAAAPLASRSVAHRDWRGGVKNLLLSVVVPAYNEAATVEAALRRVRDVPLRVEIIVVNDASTDGTREILDQLARDGLDRKSTRLNSSHRTISYAVFCLKKKIIGRIEKDKECGQGRCGRGL